MGRKQDFSNSVIYHIRHIESNEIVYVGSTTNFTQRKTKHKYKCNHEEGKEFTSTIYCHIRDNGGFDCFEVIPIKSLKLGNKTELLIAEQEEIDKHETLVNRKKAHMTIEETHIYHNEKNKKWRENNPEKYKQISKRYNEKAKKWRENNPENKENINEKRNESIKCPICNSISQRGNLKRHQRTKKCQEYLNK